jgi:hypothetical protein
MPNFFLFKGFDFNVAHLIFSLTDCFLDISLFFIYLGNNMLPSSGKLPGFGCISAI